ncbi:NACHT domain-containing protein [Alkaliphilus peptidifermentans]|uniref:NACHT domain-containing protein n=1 Tax=Alkaliphilus peptidifermentans DSM 18978 TaxID=1120976 RepID=A0A1G5LD24_9FIRM|nr:NACHT domain-containing protein [Alkaliphilus peptidifermentans]SCZ10817.1 NACHT domain-containing protein [Alkaliphilus peptidifermentans DSM 18978]
MNDKAKELNINEIIISLVERHSEKICDSISKFLKDNRNKLLIDFNLAFKKYLSNAYEKYSKIKTLLYRTEPKYLYDFFECNTLMYGNEIINSEDVNNVLNISKFIIIQGTGGIGKTTLMKHFFIDELKKDDLIPVFIELKDLNKKDRNLYNCIYNSLCLLGFDLELEYLEYALKSGCFLILLDGYDEIDSNLNAVSLAEIRDFCDKYNENYYIISSRPNDTFISLQRFTVIESLDFSKEQAISLVEKLDYDKPIKERFLEELKSNLYDNHKSFASNPLLLNIMLLTFDNYAEIPEKLHIFYSNAFETLYSKHDATKGGYKREMLSKLSYDNFKRIFAKFCFTTYIKNCYEFTIDELIDYMNDVLKTTEVECNIQFYINDLIHAICALYLDGNKYKFTHRSFQEYFTAVYLKELSDVQQSKVSVYLIENRGFGYKHDKVFDMFYDMAKDRFERNIIIPLLKELENKMDRNDERYLEYFRSLVEGISIKQGDNGEVQLWKVSSLKNPKADFIFYITKKYPIAKHIYSNEDYVKRLLMQLKEEEMEELSFDCKDIINDIELYEYVNKSWIGESVLLATNLLKELTIKQNKIINDLNELLK